MTATERAQWWAVDHWLTISTFPLVLIVFAFVLWLVLRRNK